MRFDVRHTFRDISAAEYEDLYFSEDFNIALCEAVSLARTLVSREHKDGVLHRIVKVGPDRDIPAPIAKVLGANRIEYTEHIDYTLGSLHGHWKTVSSLMTDRVTTQGTFRFTESGTSVTREIDGDIRVKIFGVGGMVEKFIVADIERSYGKAAEFTQRWIDTDGNP